MNRIKYYGIGFRRIMSLVLMMVLIATMSLGLSGCSSSQAESSSETGNSEESDEEPVTSEDTGIYGDASLGIDAGVDEQLRDYRTILIAGIDNGNRADIQLILAMNKKTNEARIFTVSRDTYMQIADGEDVDISGTDYEFCKCNRAYKYGGKYGLMKELNMHMDLNIREFIGVDWDCARDLVDSLGGLRITLSDQNLIDGLNQRFGKENYIEAGKEAVLTGDQAVTYLRIRKYKGGGPRAREERNREVFKQLFDQAKSMDLEDLSEVYDLIAGQLDTNMSRNSLTDIISLISSMNVENTENWPYEYNKYWEPDGHFNYFVPDSLISNVKELHANIFDQQDYLPSMTVQVLQGRIDELVDSRLVRKKPK